MDISVITTAYNSERYISECIESVINQITENQFNYEHIIVNDGSTDNTEKIIQKYQKKYKHIVYINSGKVGRAKALNLAVRESRGWLVANLDSDDLFHPLKLLSQWNFIKNNNGVDLISTKSLIFNKDIIFSDELEDGYGIIKNDLFIKNKINHSSVIFKKDTFFELEGYNEARTTQIDLEFWFRFLNSNKKMMILNSKLTGKRVHQEQSFENKNRLSYIIKAINLKTDYAIKMGHYRYLPIIYGVFFFDILPVSVRAKLRNFVRS